MSEAPQAQDAVPRHTVLVVDDTPQNLTLLGELLSPFYRVRVATDGARALRIAQTAPTPDLILLDVMMPDMDGYAVLRQLHVNPITSHIPVIFVTAMDALEDEQKGFDLGAVDYIIKPMRPGIVLARIRAQLELKEARDRLQAQNSWLEAEVARRMVENQRIQDVSIHALAHLAEARDPETGNHLHRTQGYVRLLAEHLKASPGFEVLRNPGAVDNLAKSAPLHDIGKVGIPDHILLKPGKLTPDEWVIMQTHAAQGADAIAMAENDIGMELEFLARAKEIARHHHERWDGTGYPDRLQGAGIPVAARLMALADVFDALISRRSYKEPFTFRQAFTMIIEGRGSHFDPEVVDAFIANFDAFCDIAQRHADEGQAT